MAWNYAYCNYISGNDQEAEKGLIHLVDLIKTEEDLNNWEEIAQTWRRDSLGIELFEEFVVQQTCKAGWPLAGMATPAGLADGAVRRGLSQPRTPPVRSPGSRPD